MMTPKVQFKYLVTGSNICAHIYVHERNVKMAQNCHFSQFWAILTLRACTYICAQIPLYAHE